VNIEELSEAIADEIDRQLEPKTAKSFYLSLVQNIKQRTNRTFYLKILSGQVRPSELPQMGRQDMADDEQKAKDQKESDNALIALIEFNKEMAADMMKPHYKKTKKGEEPIESEQVSSIHSFDGHVTEKSPSQKCILLLLLLLFICDLNNHGLYRSKDFFISQI